MASIYFHIFTWCEQWQILTANFSFTPNQPLTAPRIFGGIFSSFRLCLLNTEIFSLSSPLEVFFLKFPLPALGEAVSNSRWGPEAGCTVASWVCPSSRPLSLSLPPPPPPPPTPAPSSARTHPDRSELGGPTRQRHKPEAHRTHCRSSVCKNRHPTTRCSLINT